MRIQYAHKQKQPELKDIMQTLFNSAAPKKPTNLSINSDLLQKAKNLKINLSATLENALTQIVKEKQEQEWLAANKKAIKNYNELIEKNGVFNKELRSF